MPQQQRSARGKNLADRQLAAQLNALQAYILSSNLSQRSSDIDNSMRTLSIMDELEAQEVLSFRKRDSVVADNVYGDIYRNRFLASVCNPP